MTFIPNEANAGIDGEQAELDSVDLDVILDGFRLRGVQSGCAVSAGPGALQTTVAAGTILYDGAAVAVAGGALTHAAAGSQLRFDLVVSDSSGALSIINGTAFWSATYGPTLPIYTDKVVLAVVCIPANALSIASANITDHRVILATTADHGLLTGLSDDDHTQYLLANGSRALTGHWVQSGAFNIYHAGAMRVGSSSTPTNITAGDLTVVRLNVGNVAFGTGVESVLGGDATLSGFLRVGSNTEPANTTAGDLSVTRLDVGQNTAFSNLSGLFAKFVGTLVNTAPGAVVAFNCAPTISPATDSSSEFRVLNMSALVSASDVAIGTVASIVSEIDYRALNPGATGDVTGVLETARMTGIVLRSTNNARQAVSIARALLIMPYNRPSGTGTVSVTDMYGILINGPTSAGATVTNYTALNITNPGASFAPTNLFGIDIEALTRGGTLNFGIRNASNLVQTQYARFGAVTAPGNTTDGDVTVVRLFVNNDSNFSLAIVSSNPRFLVDSTDFMDYVRASNYWEWKIASTVVARLGGSSTDPYFELQVAGTLAAAAASTVQRMYMYAGSAVVLGGQPRFMDSNTHDSGVTIRGKNSFPVPLTPYTSTKVAITPTTAQGHVGLVSLTEPIMLHAISFNVSTASAGANGITRIGIYNESGGLITSVSSTAGLVLAVGVNTLTLSADVYLPGGRYYVAIVRGADYATTQPIFSAYTQDNTFQDVTGQEVICGTFVATAGALPDPLGTITSANNSTLMVKFYGAAL